MANNVTRKLDTPELGTPARRARRRVGTTSQTTRDSMSSAGQHPLTQLFSQQKPRDCAKTPAQAALAAAASEVGDPVQRLRAAAALKALTLELFGGSRTVGETHPLPPAVADELLALVASNMSGFSDWDHQHELDDRRAEMTNPRTRVLVLRSEEDGALVGFASYRCMSQETVAVAYLLELQLDVRHRRRGVGSLLLRAVCDFGRAAQRRGLLLTVHLENSGACHFYHACGLEISPISPARCAPAGLAFRHHIMQLLWDAAAQETMRTRGEATRVYLLEQASRRARAQASAAAKATLLMGASKSSESPPTPARAGRSRSSTKRPRPS